MFLLEGVAPLVFSMNDEAVMEDDESSSVFYSFVKSLLSLVVVRSSDPFPA